MSALGDHSRPLAHERLRDRGKPIPIVSNATPSPRPGVSAVHPCARCGHARFWHTWLKEEGCIHVKAGIQLPVADLANTPRCECMEFVP